jgi:non-heme chloroperoxidase
MTSDPRTIRLRNGLELSYVDQGERASPAVMLVPGLTDSWRTFELVLPHVPPSIRVIAPSLRGHGDSDKPDSGYRTSDFASDVAELLDALELSRTVVVGHSSSGLVAQRFAIDNPARTAGIVLEGGFASFRSNPAAVEFVTKAIPALHDPLDPEFVREWAEGTTKAVPRAFMDTMVAEILKVPARVWRAAFEGLLQVDHTAELGAVRVPTLLIWGDQDTLASRDHQDVLSSGIPQAELVVYEGVGHTAHWEKPRRFAADLVAFTERVTHD